jgi:uncharacterized membrane protein YcaP (DUF421 family)
VLQDQFQVTSHEVLSVAVAVICLYLLWMLMAAWIGPRMLVVSSAGDFAVVAASGAVLGRTALLEEPTIATGLLALLMFALVHAASVALRRSPRLAATRRRSLLLVRDGQLVSQNTRTARISEHDIRQAVRSAGARSLDDVRCVVLETNGSLSVIVGRGPIDPWILADLDGARRGAKPDRRVTR